MSEEQRKRDANPIDKNRWFAFRRNADTRLDDPSSSETRSDSLSEPGNGRGVGLTDGAYRPAASRAPAHAVPAHIVDLPFTLRLARTPEMVEKALEVRHRAYSYHYPWMGEELSSDEDEDCTANAVIFVCESKEDGTPLGSVRIQTNLGTGIQTKMPFFIPDEYSSDSLAFISRLSVIRHRDRKMVKVALFKAIYQYSCAMQIKWMVTAAIEQTAPIYRQLGFFEAYEDKRRYVGKTGVAGVYLFHVPTCESRWREQKHPYYEFFFEKTAPDIQIFNSVSGSWTRPRDIGERPRNAPVGRMVQLS